MASTINASSTGSGGLITTGDASGELALQANGVTKATVTANGLSLASNSSINALNTFGFENRLINGAMVIDQRNAGASFTPTDGQYGLDRFLMSQSTAGKYTCQQNAGSVTPPVGFAYYMGITSLSAYTLSSTDFFGMQQRIEGVNIYDLGWGTANAKTCTLSFWVRSSLTGTFGGSLRSGDFGLSYAFSYTINAANTWEQKTITITGPTTGTFYTTTALGFSVIWGWGTGSNYLTSTLNAWQSGTYLGPTGQTNVVGTNGATFYITGLQLEAGTQATSFDFRSYGTELASCQRYYEIAGSGITGTWQNPQTVQTGWNFKVTKRTTPTISLLITNMVVATPRIPADYTASGSALTTTNPTQSGSRVIFNGFSGPSAGDGAIVYSDAWVCASAEL